MPGLGGAALQVRDRLWSDFSFVASSGAREKIVAALGYAPKLPRQLAVDTNLGLPHVSRSLRELTNRGLVECLTPSARSHGRRYALTKLGTNLVAYMQNSAHRLSRWGGNSSAAGFVPKIRASAATRFIEYLTRTRGRATVLAALKDWSVDPEELNAETWLSAVAFEDFLELLVSNLGGGSYDFLRTLASQALPTIPSIWGEIVKVIPLSIVFERAPIIYNKEVNYGRLVVSRGRREARLQLFDWMPIEASCATFHGLCEGVLRARGADGTVTKTQCVRSGHDRCEYLVRW